MKVRLHKCDKSVTACNNSNTKIMSNDSSILLLRGKLKICSSAWDSRSRTTVCTEWTLEWLDCLDIEPCIVALLCSFWKILCSCGSWSCWTKRGIPGHCQCVDFREDCAVRTKKDITSSQRYSGSPVCICTIYPSSTARRLGKTSLTQGTQARKRRGTPRSSKMRLSHLFSLLREGVKNQWSGIRIIPSSWFTISLFIRVTAVFLRKDLGSTYGRTLGSIWYLSSLGLLL